MGFGLPVLRPRCDKLKRLVRALAYALVGKIQEQKIKFEDCPFPRQKPSRVKRVGAGLKLIDASMLCAQINQRKFRNEARLRSLSRGICGTLPLVTSACPFANLPEKKRAPWALTSEERKNVCGSGRNSSARVNLPNGRPRGICGTRILPGCGMTKTPPDCQGITAGPSSHSDRQ